MSDWHYFMILIVIFFLIVPLQYEWVARIHQSKNFAERVRRWGSISSNDRLVSTIILLFCTKRIMISFPKTDLKFFHKFVQIFLKFYKNILPFFEFSLYFSVSFSKCVSSLPSLELLQFFVDFLGLVQSWTEFWFRYVPFESYPYGGNVSLDLVWQFQRFTKLARILPILLNYILVCFSWSELLEFKLRVSNVGSPVCDNNVWVIKEWVTIIFTWV